MDLYAGLMFIEILSGMLRRMVLVTCAAMTWCIRLNLFGVILMMSLLRIRSSSWELRLVRLVDMLTTVIPTMLVVEFRTGVPNVTCLVTLCCR